VLRGPKRDEDDARWRTDEEETFVDPHSLDFGIFSTIIISVEAAELAVLTSTASVIASTVSPEDVTRSTVALMTSVSSPALRRRTGGTAPCEKSPRS
jgi:hypothetical protein